MVLITDRMRTLANINEAEVSFNPEAFFGRWFLSNKKSIPKEWYKEMESLYPYKGTAFRLDTEPPLKKPYSSWSKSINGIRAWLRTQNEFGIIPNDMVVIKANITGIDLMEFVKDQGLSHKSAKLMLEVEEVTPTKTVSGIQVVARGG